VSTGNGFAWQPGWVSGVQEPAAFGTGDFNGDGKTDIVSYESSSASFQVGLSTGASFSWRPNWLTGVQQPAKFGTGDFNGS
jgi:hypothetical protein